MEASPRLPALPLGPSPYLPSSGVSGGTGGGGGPKQKKYIFINGVMMINPEYQSENHPSSSSSPVASSSQPGGKGTKSPILPLAIISCPEDLRRANEDKYGEEENPNEPRGSGSGGTKVTEGTPISFSLGTLQAIDTMQHSEYQTAMTRLKEPSLLDGLTEHFVIYEIPIGLISKLILLRDYHLHFMIDDSGSMRLKTDVTYRQATPFVRLNRPPDDFLTRFEEAEDRLHIMMDILSYIPVKSLTISFMNLPTILSFSDFYQTPHFFQTQAHGAIQSAFRSFRGGGTPTLATLTKSFTTANELTDPTLHYLFTDGIPSDCSISQLSAVIAERRKAERNPLTLISCTDNESECEWMKEIEERAKYCSELDDYRDEKEEVLKDQGPAFPYTRGLWLVSHLIAAICPHDLDAIDESLPFTKHTLDELMGRVHCQSEYEYYWKHHPKHKKYNSYFTRFLTEEIPARYIVPKTAAATISSVCSLM